MKPNDEKPLKIHVGAHGEVRFDSDEFFARPVVQKKLEMLKNMDIVGLKLILKRDEKNGKLTFQRVK